MQNRHFWTLILAGLLLTMVGGLLLLATPAPTNAQDGEDEREYVGTRQCGDCHRDLTRAHDDSPHLQTLQDVEDEDDKELILGDFEQGEAVRTVQFPGSDEARPFDAEDILFTIGTGRYVQRYVYEADDEEYLVLPAEWNTVTGEWQPFELAEQWPDPAYDFVDNCVYCHVTGLDLERVRWEEDGVQCEACHGPGSEHVRFADRAGRNPSVEETQAIRATINSGLDAQTCGQCHSRGHTVEGDSPYPLNYLPGDDLSAVFEIVPADDPVHWWQTGHAAEPNMQYNEWSLSGHGNALSSMIGSDYADPSCMHCHSSLFRYAEGQLVKAGDTDEVMQRVPLSLVAFAREHGLEGTDLTQEYERVLPLVLVQLEVEAEDMGGYDELVNLLMETVNVEEDDLEEGVPLVPQLLPGILEELGWEYDEDEPPQVEGPVLQLMPLVVQDLIQNSEVELDEMEVVAVQAETYGVTCASCHNPHNIDEENLHNSLLANEDAYALCVDCHSQGDSISAIHHPVQEMYEGTTLIPEIEGIPGSHFTKEGGPTCQTCHMPVVPVETATRVSHTLDPILPFETIDIEALRDSCTSCHTDYAEFADAEALTQFINDIQADTAARLEAANAALTDNSPDWVRDALAMVEGDGSLGMHNYIYADELLYATEVELGVVAAPEPAPPPAASTRQTISEVQAEAENDVIIAGFTLGGVILLGAAALSVLLAVGFFIFSTFKLFSVVALIGAVILVGGGLLIRDQQAQPDFDLTGQDDYCMLCHAKPAFAFEFPDSSTVDLHVDVERFMTSVHGAEYEDGAFGCVDCHGEMFFPHRTLTFASAGNYRVQMSSICIDCHVDHTDHYVDVLERNILVGCSDCHTAHYVIPADELEAAALPPVP